MIIGTLLSGCSTTSVVIPADDREFIESQGRLERTMTDIAKLSPPAAERALFLQAEAFYRYRFAPPERNASSYAAQALAAITDFPAFQAMAGALDLLDLRLRTSDSAVQLWETLLQNYPKTPLRGLTLYRLGWAYRSVGTEGLPRESPDEAFDQLIKEEPHSPLSVLAGEAKAAPWKSKSSASTRSLLPGLGQIYVGETTSGVVRLAIASLAAVAIAVPAYIAEKRGGDLRWNRDWPLLATGFGGLVALSFDFTNSYEDSMRGVVQWNEREEAAFNRSHPSAP